MTRQQALKTITADVAKNGKVDFFCTRLYIECRMSKQAFNEAVAKGMRIHNNNLAYEAEMESMNG